MKPRTDPYTVLVVEDDPAHQMLVRQAVMASDTHCSVVQVAGDIQEALRFLEQMEFDVLLVDNRLPDGWGLDLVTDLRDAGSTTPLVLMTNAGSEVLAVQAWRSRLTNYIIKDGQFWRDVPSVLRAAVDKRRAELEDEEAHSRLERAHTRLEDLHRDIQLSNEELRQGKRELEAHRMELVGWNASLEGAIEDLHVFSRAVSQGLNGPVANLRAAVEALATNGTSSEGKKVKTLVKKALDATSKIEATARQFKALYTPTGQKKEKAPKVDLDVLVTRIRESMARKSNTGR